MNQKISWVQITCRNSKTECKSKHLEAFLCTGVLKAGCSRAWTDMCFICIYLSTVHLECPPPPRSVSLINEWSAYKTEQPNKVILRTEVLQWWCLTRLLHHRISSTQCSSSLYNAVHMRICGRWTAMLWGSLRNSPDLMSDTWVSLSPSWGEGGRTQQTNS